MGVTSAPGIGLETLGNSLRVIMQYDALIFGAGSAGLSAALTLGRCLRRVLMADGGPLRNESSPSVYGFLTRDGIRPAELLRLGYEHCSPTTRWKCRD